MKEARNITKGTLNGRNVKFFEVWELREGAWHFVAKYAAPAKVANKNVVAWAENQDN